MVPVLDRSVRAYLGVSLAELWVAAGGLPHEAVADAFSYSSLDMY